MLEKVEMTPKVATLKRMNLREVWMHEAASFTPWLVENIHLLGEAIGVQLEVQAQEKAVGMFRADIVASDVLTSEVVLVENQIERTDHGHLGQLITYAAGLQAVTMVWVAEKFCDEHRAALDWLNESMSSGVRFFGLEIELWQIEDSPPAAKFNVVCQPNSWKKRVSLRPEGSAEERLQVAYDRMVKAGTRMSGRALASEARVNRTTANRWLAEVQPELIEAVVSVAPEP